MITTISVIYAIILLSLSYTLGALNSAFYLLKKFQNIDIRNYYSGNAGATNVQRVLGNKWFLLIAGIDLIKGFLTVSLSQLLYHELYIAALLAAIIGHCYPAQLNFKGGRGLAILIGGTAAISPIMLITLISLFVIIFMVSSRPRFSVLLTIGLIPVLAILFEQAYYNIILLTVTAIIIVHNYLFLKKAPKR